MASGWNSIESDHPSCSRVQQHDRLPIDKNLGFAWLVRSVDSAPVHLRASVLDLHGRIDLRVAPSPHEVAATDELDFDICNVGHRGTGPWHFTPLDLVDRSNCGLGMLSSLGGPNRSLDGRANLGYRQIDSSVCPVLQS